VVQRLERRTLCAATPAGFAAGGAPALSQLVVRGEVKPVGDEDWYSLGGLHAGDVITLSLSGFDAGRGTLPDPWVRLYRLASEPARPALVASDNDAGTGRDALVLRQSLPADDVYLVRAIGNFGTAGTYELSAWLEAAPPVQGGHSPGATAEVEPNGDATMARDVSAAWAAARYVSARDVSLKAGEVNDEALALRAGDVVSVVVDSTSALDAGVSVEDEAGVPLALDRGDSDRRSGDVKDAYVFAVCLPKDAVYHVKTWGNGGTAGACRVQVYLSREVAELVGRQVFYNDSAYDARSAGAGPEDDAAVAPDKVALLPGATAKLANVTNFAAGINGIFVDVKGLRREVTGEDFEFAMSAAGGDEPWVAAPQPVSISRRVGAGVEGSDRVTLVWADGSIVNRWLRVTVKSTADNDFEADDVFYFGNLPGETGDDPTGATVTAADLLATRAHHSRRTSVTDWFDFNRDGRINALDQAIARANFSRKLILISPEPSPAAASHHATVAAVPIRGSVIRRLRYEPASAVLMEIGP
jgi:hypothetical protein